MVYTHYILHPPPFLSLPYQFFSPQVTSVKNIMHILPCFPNPLKESLL